MSGTSLDGVDGVLVRYDGDDTGHVVADASLPLPDDLRAALLALQHPGPDELHRAAQAAAALSDLYATVVERLLARAGIGAAHVAAIGAHGQTVRHMPPAHPRLAPGEAPYTLQLLAPARLAEATGIAVVADFRSRDIAAGGQGAPLVPAFHRAAFAHPGRAVAVVNIGGIANLTALCADGALLGFDTGPGNVLLDAWCERHTGARYDAAGAWSRHGRVHTALLADLLADPYFDRQGARSTGRDHFHMGWLDAIVARHPDATPVDVQATLVALTVESIARAAAAVPWGTHDGGGPQRMLVCGGGALNRALLDGLRERLPATDVTTTAAHGWPVQWVEAAAFAWLARQTLLGRPGNATEVTGARGPRILGAVYPA
ncbi:Anhydro-N-acetylmuramic acid kinase [Tepidimonas thermarum]|uniref:Anhydro-N-acetylmuramic acid kinase n=1 Tax=Tepidimonas thermarum TaxID=335431 RepID=A0A554X886_9BURK|nr:anhydro-N-acetylmuramic acid kinase [Tepidimonas thermarum]TSE31986.1 Anhydro-N-acetylmuramic acid kinase [Tepidimonas thermarum]